MNLGEFDVIARYFTREDQRRDVLLGVGDDAAVLAAPSEQRIVIAIDTIGAGVHFPLETAAEDIGYRALAVNLSDLAAMGAQPSWMTLSLSLPKADEHWLAGFAQGLFQLAELHGVLLVGGDTVRGPLVITVQIGGWVEVDGWLTRRGAHADELLFVSGHPGDAAAGLERLQHSVTDDEAAQYLQRRFLRPTPRVELGRGLRNVASAAMDVSDGLLVDLEKLCAASGCGAELDLDALPMSAALRTACSRDEQLRHALSGGDDYELLFTAPRAALPVIERMRQHHPITAIGVMTHEPGVRCVSNGRRVELDYKGYDHFAAQDDRS